MRTRRFTNTPSRWPQTSESAPAVSWPCLAGSQPRLRSRRVAPPDPGEGRGEAGAGQAGWPERTGLPACQSRGHTERRQPQKSDLMIAFNIHCSA